jgi:hypothetical protein
VKALVVGKPDGAVTAGAETLEQGVAIEDKLALGGSRHGTHNRAFAGAAGAPAPEGFMTVNLQDPHIARN